MYTPTCKHTDKHILLTWNKSFKGYHDEAVGSLHFGTVFTGPSHPLKETGSETHNLLLAPLDLLLPPNSSCDSSSPDTAIVLSLHTHMYVHTHTPLTQSSLNMSLFQPAPPRCPSGVYSRHPQLRELLDVIFCQVLERKDTRQAG